MPVVVVLLTVALTAAIGLRLAQRLQDRSFRKNQVFSAKLTRIMDSQREAADILKNVDEARRLIRANEWLIRDELAKQPTQEAKNRAITIYRESDEMDANVQMLRDSQVRLDALVSLSNSFSAGSAIRDASGEYSKELEALTTCLASNVEFRCAKQHDSIVDKMQVVVAAHSIAIDQLIREYER